VAQGAKMKKNIMVLLGLSMYLLAQDTYYYKNHKKETLTPLQQKSRSINPIKYYKNTRGIVLGVNKNLIVKINNPSQLKTYSNKYGLEVLKELSKGLYLLRNNSQASTLEVANKLTLEQGVSYAHPDFIKKMIGR